MSKFVELFQKYGYNVETFGKSYIADNGVFCIPFTEVQVGDFPLISAISFLSCDKKNVKDTYKDDEYIGCAVFSDWMNNRLKYHVFGRICNHDHSLFEVETWLKKK